MVQCYPLLVSLLHALSESKKLGAFEQNDKNEGVEMSLMSYSHLSTDITVIWWLRLIEKVVCLHLCSSTWNEVGFPLLAHFTKRCKKFQQNDIEWKSQGLSSCPFLALGQSTEMWYGLSSSSGTKLGAWLMRSWPLKDFGKAMTSLMLEAPTMMDTSRSKPKRGE